MESSGQVYGAGGQSHDTALQSVVVPVSGLRQTSGEGVAGRAKDRVTPSATPSIKLRSVIGYICQLLENSYQ